LGLFSGFRYLNPFCGGLAAGRARSISE